MPQLALATCSPRETNRVHRAGTQVTVAAGTVIHAEDCPPKWVYLVLCGSAAGEDQGVERVLGAGDVHGARPVLAGDHTCGHLIAMTDARVLVLGRGEFIRLLSECAGFAHGIARQMAEVWSSTARAMAASSTGSMP